MTNWADNKEPMAQQLQGVKGASTAALNYCSNVAGKSTKLVNEGMVRQSSMEVGGVWRQRIIDNIMPVDDSRARMSFIGMSAKTQK